MNRTYAAMAAALGLEYCFGMERWGGYCHLDHRIGASTPGKVHLADTNPNWAGIFTFLKLAAAAKEPSINDDAPWVRVYRQNMLARSLGHQINIRVPSRILRRDRAFVKASVAGLPNSTPLRKEAYDWARR